MVVVTEKPNERDFWSWIFLLYLPFPNSKIEVEITPSSLSLLDNFYVNGMRENSISVLFELDVELLLVPVTLHLITKCSKTRYSDRLRSYFVRSFLCSYTDSTSSICRPFLVLVYWFTEFKRLVVQRE